MGAQAILLGLGGAGGGAVAYWNPADCDAKITLSGTGNNTATRAAVSLSTWCAVRAVTSQNSGLRYFEVQNANDSGGPTMMMGLATAALPLTNFPGQTATSYGYHANAAGSETYNNNVSANSGGTKVAIGSYGRCAVDFTAGKLWLGNPTVWKGGGDPALGTSPTYTFVAGTALFPTLGEFSTTQVCVLRLAAADMVGALPSGFSAWV